MKKIFGFVAVALVAFGFAACNQNTPSQKEVNLTFTENVRYTDAVESDGWWQIMAQDSAYFLTLSNKDEIKTAAGTYAVADLDPDYSYLIVIATEKEITFTDGSVTLTPGNDGSVKVEGKLTGSDSIIYNINVLYTQPTAKKTVQFTAEGYYYDLYADYGLHAVYGTSADEAYYIQLSVWTEEGDDLQGDFTEEDLDNYYLGSYVEDAEGEQEIFTAAFTSVPGNGAGEYQVSGEVLCFNNTLYKFTLTTTEMPAEAPKKAPAKKDVKKVFRGARAL